MPDPTTKLEQRYASRINAAQTARAKLAVAGEFVVMLLRIQAGVAFCATLGVIIWMVFHGYTVWPIFFVGLAWVFQVVLFLYLASFAQALTETQVETMRSSLTTMCLTLGLPDPEPA